MKGFKTTVFILSVLILSSQSIHYVYMKYFYDTSSVLDESIDKEIKSSEKIEDLLIKYTDVKEQIKIIENKNLDKERQQVNRLTEDLRDTERKLENGIRDWERKQEKYRQLTVQWVLGLLVLLAGVFLYRKKYQWEGLAFVVAGIFEMLWWSSPSTRLGGAISEFERLLNAKLLLSLVTLSIILFIWILDYRVNKK